MTRSTLLLALLAGLAVVASGAVALLERNAPRVTVSVDPAAVTPELGRAFESPLRPPASLWWAASGDTLATGDTSDLELREDGRPLGPGHSRHPDVRERGGGAFSHWHQRVIFSSSDGSDPRTNGRSYQATLTLAPAPWITWSASLLWVAAAFAAWWGPARRHPRLQPWLFAATAALLLLAWNGVLLRCAPAWISVQEDTMSYLNGSTMRTPGYPWFLRAVTLLCGDLRFLAWVQVNLLAASVICMAWSAARALGGWGWAVSLLVLVGSASRVFETSFSAMADGPFTACSCLLAAALLRCAAASGPTAARWTLAAALAAGAAVLLRPVGMAFLPVLLLPAIWHAGWRLRHLAAGAAALLILLGASAWNLSRHGFFGLSTMGPISIAGHVGWMISPETVPSQPELARRIQARLAPILARRPDPLPWPTAYYLWTSDEYNELLYVNILPEVDAFLAEEGRGTQPDAVAATARRRDALLAAIGTEPILARPADYARHVAANVVGAWYWSGRASPIMPSLARSVPPSVQALSRLEPQQMDLFRAWIAPPAPDGSWQRTLVWERLRRPLDAWPRLYALAGVLACAAGLLAAPFGRRASAAWRALSVAAAMVMGSFLLIALSATVIFRYVDAADPLIALALLAAAAVASAPFRARPPAPGAAPAPPARAATGRT